MSPHSQPEDVALVAAAIAGDERAFATLMQSHKDRLYRFIRRYTGEGDEAYDLLQESFASAWSALQRYDQVRPFDTWLRSIALNKCRDWSRRRMVRRWLTHSDSIESRTGAALATSDPSAETQLANRQRLAQLDAAIARLPASLKEPLLLTVFDELSHEEAGRLLGLSAKAIEVRVYRARRALADALGSER